MIKTRLSEPADRRLPADVRQQARRYAYRFFFEFPFPYPWHVIHFWKDMEDRPFEDVISTDGLRPYLDTLDALTGTPIDWTRRGSGAENLRVAS
jgi:hypothetical protein